MSVLVAYASRHGATEQIAQRIAEVLRASRWVAEARPMEAAGDLAGYDAFVIGSAVYYGSWLKEATAFVRRHQAVLAGRPVWLFSSGPLGTAATDDKGQDLRVAAVPKEIAAFTAALKPRDHRVFFGVLDPRTLGIAERVVRALPAGRALLPEGDFRDWQEVEAWAEEIARAVASQAPSPVARGAAP
jgi:menaquinone-dependent protoporphyrinogen oxidase